VAAHHYARGNKDLLALVLIVAIGCAEVSAA